MRNRRRGRGNWVDAVTAHFEDAAADLKRQVAALEQRLQAAAAERDEALAQQAAVAEVLEVINAKPGDLDAAFDAIVERAIRFCDATGGGLWLVEGDIAQASGATRRTLPAPFIDFVFRTPARLIDLLGRSPQQQSSFHVEDVKATKAYRDKAPFVVASAELGAIRTFLGVPLREEGAIVGVFTLIRDHVRPFTEKQIALVQAFAAQALIAMKNARLFNEAREALERQTATADVLKVIAGSPSDTQPVFDAIAESAKRLLGGHTGVVVRFVGEWMHLAAYTPIDPDSDAALKALYPMRRLPADSPFGETFLRQGVSEIVDTEAEPYREIRDAGRARGFRSRLIALLRVDGEPFGWITVARKEPGRFAPHDIQLLQTFADQAVIAIQNARLFNETQEALKRQTATSEILRVISESPTDARPVFESIVLTAARLLRCDMAFVMLREGDGYARVAGATRDGPLDLPPESFPIDPSANFPSRVFLARTVLHLPDWSVVELPEHERRRREQFDIASALYLPMLRGDECIGLLTLGSREAHNFGPGEISLAESFRDQALIAIENARLFNETQEALEGQTETSEILRVISRSPTDARPVFESIVVTAVRLLRCDMGIVLLRDGDAYVHSVGATKAGRIADLAPERFPIDPDANFPSRAILAKEMLYLADWSLIDLPEHERNIRATFGVNSALYLPLLREGEGECIGVLALVGNRPNSFGPKEIAHAESFRDQAMIAIENARLFNETQEALDQQRASAEVLSVIGKSVSDAAPVFEKILDACQRLFGSDELGIYTVGDDGMVRAAAWRGERGAEARNDVTPLEESVTGRIIRERHTHHIPDLGAQPNLSATLRERVHRHGSASLLYAPMLWEERGPGSILVVRSPPKPFSEREQALLQTFANQAAIAIQNARMFRETQEALSQQTATADVLKVISRSAFDLQAVLDTLVASAARLCEAEKACINLRQGELYRWVSNFGFDEDLVTYARSHPLAAGGSSVTSRVARDKRPVHITDVLADPSYTASEYQRLGNYRTMLGVPLLREGEPIGVFIMTREAVRAFNQRQIELLQTFADQAVIAIENVRLFDEVQAKTRELTEALVHQTGSANILKVIAASPTDVAPVLKEIVESACNVCDAYDAAVLLRDGEHLRFSAHRGPIPIGLEKWPVNRGWTGGRAVVDRKPVHVVDLLNEAEEFPDGYEMARRMGHRTILAVPLIREGGSIGAIIVRRNEVHPFSEKQIALLQTFADQAVIAIGNVRLFDEVQARTKDLTEALQQQTATAEVLKVISRSAFDLDVVLNSLTKSAVELCNSTYGAISLYRDGVLKFMAQTGCTPEFAELLWSHPAQLDRKSATGRAGLLRSVVLVPDVTKDEEYDYHGGEVIGNYRSMMSVPMLRNGELEGVFTLMRAEPGTFTRRQVELVQTFADQAVIAIENVRLFNEVQARTRDLTEALAQQTATADVLKAISRTAFDLDTVLETLISTATRLCDAKHGQIFRRYGDVYRYAASQMDVDLAYRQHEQELRSKPAAGL
jgi:GAF domain-containing protein